MRIRRSGLNAGQGERHQAGRALRRTRFQALLKRRLTSLSVDLALISWRPTVLVPYPRYGAEICEMCRLLFHRRRR